MNWILQLFQTAKAPFIWWTIVAPWEQALRVRLGKQKVLLQAGIHLKVPGVHAIYKQSVRMRAVASPVQTLTTLDGKTLTLSGSIGYCVTDLEKLYETLHHADDTIRNLCMGAIAQYVHTHNLRECEPAKIEEKALAVVELKQYGLGSVKLYVTDFALVKTYRFIADHKWGSIGDTLNTSVPTPTVGPI